MHLKLLLCNSEWAVTCHSNEVVNSLVTQHHLLTAGPSRASLQARECVQKAMGLQVQSTRLERAGTGLTLRTPAHSHFVSLCFPGHLSPLAPDLTVLESALQIFPSRSPLTLLHTLEQLSVPINCPDSFKAKVKTRPPRKSPVAGLAIILDLWGQGSPILPADSSDQAGGCLRGP